MFERSKIKQDAQDAILSAINKEPVDFRLKILLLLVGESKTGVTHAYASQHVIGFDDYGASATTAILNRYGIPFMRTGFPHILMTQVWLNEGFQFGCLDDELIANAKKMYAERSAESCNGVFKV